MNKKAVFRLSPRLNWVSNIPIKTACLIEAVFLPFLVNQPETSISQTIAHSGNRAEEGELSNTL